MAWTWRLAPAMAALTLAGCVHVSGPGCAAGMHAAPVAELFFGRSIKGGGSVSDADFAHFVDAEVAPRFPDGFTLLDGEGAWRAPDGKPVRERSKVLLIILAGRSGESAKLDAIRKAYKARFHQESVLLVEQKACVSFEAAQPSADRAGRMMGEGG